MTKLFPRKPGTSRDMHAYAKALAHRLLDKAREGDEFSLLHVDWALVVTGDRTDPGISECEVSEVDPCMH
jgi:hypothetical protein